MRSRRRATLGDIPESPPAPAGPSSLRDPDTGRSDRRILERARAALREGRDGVADLAGQRLELRTVIVTGGRVLALARADLVTEPWPGCSELAGNLWLQPRRAPGDPELWLAGWWRRVSTIEVLADAPAWLHHLPTTALIDPRQWIDSATVLALDVTDASLSPSTGPEQTRPVLHLTDCDLRFLLQG